MHWFWRGVIAIAVGSIPFVPIAVRGGPPMWYYAVSLAVGPMVAHWLLILAPSLLLGIATYAALTLRFGPNAVAALECRCRNCGYILRGITEPRCPECGERI